MNTKQLETKIRKLENDTVDNYNSIVDLKVWIIVIIFLLAVSYILIFVVVIPNLYSNPQTQDYTKNPGDFCKHYNMTYFEDEICPYSFAPCQYLDLCKKIVNDKINESREIIKINERWVFKE